MTKLMAAAEFKEKCLRVINQMTKDREPVAITKRGQPVAILSPVKPHEEYPSVIGAMRGSVLGYHDPFRPAADASDWGAAE